ncbi:hypothetical protein H6P81_020421 [Aristolochia fimbriata]|uniref:Uncharacterized protein n=1 Tax=Aristolochia fimbriata TaxID=158543 RepID=A0AAV7DVJ4_ARIFI|nr:hypothetical protein H6P81_020421 [Aristolochia fimbriata]
MSNKAKNIGREAAWHVELEERELRITTSRKERESDRCDCQILGFYESDFVKLKRLMMRRMWTLVWWKWGNIWYRQTLLGVGCGGTFKLPLLNYVPEEQGGCFCSRIRCSIIALKNNTEGEPFFSLASSFLVLPQGSQSLHNNFAEVLGGIIGYQQKRSFPQFSLSSYVWLSLKALEVPDRREGGVGELSGFPVHLGREI